MVLIIGDKCRIPGVDYECLVVDVQPNTPCVTVAWQVNGKAQERTVPRSVVRKGPAKFGLLAMGVLAFLVTAALFDPTRA